MLSPKLSLVSFASFLSHFWSIFLSHLFRGCLSSSRFGSVGATFFPFAVFSVALVPRTSCLGRSLVFPLLNLPVGR